MCRPDAACAVRGEGGSVQHGPSREGDMDTDALTPELLRKLREPKAYPAVSLTMPTHRREPDNEQDSVRLRNLMAEAGRRLDADEAVGRQARGGIKAQLEQAVAGVDLRRSL